MMKTISFVALLASSALAQQPTLQDSLLDQMTGNWILRGTIAGKATVHDIDAEWVLNHQYVRIHEISREKNANGPSAYEAEVYAGWDQAAGEYVCIWLDVWGGVSQQSIGRAKPHGAEIPFLFSEGSGNAVFHTTFAYSNDTRTWQWLMDNDENGNQQAFARVTLTRK